MLFNLFTLKVPYVACVACGIDKYYSLSQHGYSYYTQHPVLRCALIYCVSPTLISNKTARRFKTRHIHATLIKMTPFPMLLYKVHKVHC